MDDELPLDSIYEAVVNRVPPRPNLATQSVGILMLVTERIVPSDSGNTVGRKTDACYLMLVTERIVPSDSGNTVGRKSNACYLMIVTERIVPSDSDNTVGR